LRRRSDWLDGDVPDRVLKESVIGKVAPAALGGPISSPIGATRRINEIYFYIKGVILN